MGGEGGREVAFGPRFSGGWHSLMLPCPLAFSCHESAELPPGNDVGDSDVGCICSSGY